MIKVPGGVVPTDGARAGEGEAVTAPMAIQPIERTGLPDRPAAASSMILPVRAGTAGVNRFYDFGTCQPE
jgi:hypothetical protein